MKNINIYLDRVRRLTAEVFKLRFTKGTDLEASFIYDEITPIPYKTALKADYTPIKIGDKWADNWGCAWFKFSGKVPSSFKGKHVGVLIDIAGEGLYFKDGIPHTGITYKQDHYLHIGKAWIPLFACSEGNEDIGRLLDAAANVLFG
ncbi:MAG: hypothetical protein P9L91_04815, partial [Candidatus Zophobacter franzmannii]|nr:hypothetical protein [Candidatus Zophobacter franzmannii]